MPDQESQTEGEQLAPGAKFEEAGGKEKGERQKKKN